MRAFSPLSNPPSGLRRPNDGGGGAPALPAEAPFVEIEQRPLAFSSEDPRKKGSE